jgi:hypothetical protein
MGAFKNASIPYLPTRIRREAVGCGGLARVVRSLAKSQ